jgi:integrase
MRICAYPDRRIKAIVYTMVSSGMRIGAWDYLRWKDMSPIIRDDKVVAAKLKVYSEDEEEYFSFITPEAFHALDDWIKYRKECGENINENSWVMRNLWDVTTPKGKGIVTIPKKLKSTGVKRLIENALWGQRVRTKLEEGKRRHEFQADHGFRKWFKTRCEIAGMRSINIEMLMSHSIGISDSYYRPTEEDLLNDYLKAVPLLTIGEECRLQERVEELTEKSQANDYLVSPKLQEKDNEIKKMNEQIQSMQEAQKEIMDLLKDPIKLMTTLKKE